mmetsp:Transcript_10975/g.46875  ORF Transcript_10975/g.46875 Transcript_10975/m.46875 type:complete len:276 (-) Transcript_10975:759-1586(-)
MPAAWDPPPPPCAAPLNLDPPTPSADPPSEMPPALRTLAPETLLAAYAPRSYACARACASRWCDDKACDEAAEPACEGGGARVARAPSRAPRSTPTDGRSLEDVAFDGAFVVARRDSSRAPPRRLASDAFVPVDATDGAGARGIWIPLPTLFSRPSRPSLSACFAASRAALDSAETSDARAFFGCSSACRLFSASRISRKYGCRSACRALRRSSGSYASSFVIRSTHSGAQCGMSFSMPDPLFGAKLKSMCCDRCFIFARSSGLGVPTTLWIFWI